MQTNFLKMDMIDSLPFEYTSETQNSVSCLLVDSSKSWYVIHAVRSIVYAILKPQLYHSDSNQINIGSIILFLPCNGLLFGALGSWFYIVHVIWVMVHETMDLMLHRSKF